MSDTVMAPTEQLPSCCISGQRHRLRAPAGGGEAKSNSESQLRAAGGWVRSQVRGKAPPPDVGPAPGRGPRPWTQAPPPPASRPYARSLGASFPQERSLLFSSLFCRNYETNRIDNRPMEAALWLSNGSQKKDHFAFVFIFKMKVDSYITLSFLSLVCAL